MVALNLNGDATLFRDGVRFPACPSDIGYLMEIWKDVVGFEDYFKISNYGNVWSKRTSRLLKQHKSKTGYMSISSRIGGKKGKCICLKIHRMVAEAFLDNLENKPQVNHKDGVKDYNYVENLEWCNNSENIRHAYDTGLKKARSGFEHYNSNLSEDQVNYIRLNYIPKCKINGARALGKKFNVAHSTIYRAARKETYAE